MNAPQGCARAMRKELPDSNTRGAQVPRAGLKTGQNKKCDITY